MTQSHADCGGHPKPEALAAGAQKELAVANSA
jgi:hypothetical protein